MHRGTALLLIAIGLAVYGLYHAVHAIAMLPAPAAPLLLLAFVLQALLAFLAAVLVWRRQGAAAAVLLLLGATVALTAGIEAFVLGTLAWLHALLIAIVAIAIALLLGAYVDGTGGLFPRRGRSPTSPDSSR